MTVLDLWQPVTAWAVYGMAAVLYLWVSWRAIPYWSSRFVLACFVFLPLQTQVLLLAAFLVWAHTKREDDAPQKVLFFLPRSRDLS